MTKAYVREDLQENEERPSILIGGSTTYLPEEWMGRHFDCMQPDCWDEKEWNLILVHPELGVFFGNSIDWDFNDEQ